MPRENKMTTVKIDVATKQALDKFKACLTRRYGQRLKSVYLFGSRARGDFRPDSDADVAVFLESVSNPIQEQMDMGDDAYDIWMDSTIRIEPWVFEEASLTDPGKYRATQIVKTIKREGIRA